MTTSMSLYDAVNRPFASAAGLMELDADVYRIIGETASEIVVNFPVKMDDGAVKVFTGYRVQHNNSLGPFAGGVRYHPSVDLDDIRAFAVRMTWSRAMLGIPFGGAMGGIQVDPRRLSQPELERLTRRFTFSLGSNIGPEYDILAPEMGTNAQIMAWMYDTYLSTVPPQERNRSRHVVTGKPVALGGCVGRDRSAGLGLVFILEEWARERAFDLSRATFFIQGFGKVGSWAARLLAQTGAKMLAVEDDSGPIANAEGIDAEELAAYVSRTGAVARYPKAQPISHEAFLGTPADIFVPAALENQITGETAPLLKARLVAECANSPTDPEGDDALKRLGIEVIPDILGNAGSTVVAYFEWLQNRRSEFWELGEVKEKLRKTVTGAYEEVCKVAKSYGTDLRTAAHIVALTRLQNVYLKRGIFP